MPIHSDRCMRKSVHYDGKCSTKYGWVLRDDSGSRQEGQQVGVPCMSMVHPRLIQQM